MKAVAAEACRKDDCNERNGKTDIENAAFMRSIYFRALR